MERTSPENRQDKTLQWIQVRRNLKALLPSSCPAPSVFQWEVFSEGSVQYWICTLEPLHQDWVPSDHYPQTFSVRIWLERRAASVVLRYSWGTGNTHETNGVSQTNSISESKCSTAGLPISLNGTLQQLERLSHPEWAAPVPGLISHSSAGHTDSYRQKK